MSAREGPTRTTRVEVVVPGAGAAGVREVSTAEGATGCTGPSGVSGPGHPGSHRGRLLSDDQTPLELLTTVVPDERADALLAGLRRLLSAGSGAMFVSDTHVSRPEYSS